MTSARGRSKSYDAIVEDSEGGSPASGMAEQNVQQRLRKPGPNEFKELYRSLYELNPDPMFMVAPDGCFLDANPAACRLSGYSIEELLLLNFRDICTADTLAEAASAFEKNLSRESTEIEICITSKDGRKIDLLVSGSALLVDGEIKGTLGVAKDITERRQREAEVQRLNDTLEQQVAARSEALRTSERRFRNIYNHAATGIVITDLEGKIVQCNSAYCRIVGYLEGEIIMRDFSSLVHPEDQKKNNEKINSLLKNKVVSSKMENRYIHKNGNSIWAQTFISRLQCDLKKTTHLIALVSDISERKEAEEALRSSERDLLSFFDDAPIGLLWVGPDGFVRRVNQAQLTMLGYIEKEVVGRKITDFDTGQRSVSEALEQLQSGEAIKNHRARLAGKDGSWVHVLIDANPVHPGCNNSRSDWFVRDISQQVRLEGELLNIAENERRQVGAELHDHLGQILHGVSFLASQLEEQLKGKGASEAKDLARVNQALDEALQTTRHVARGLQPVHAVPEGLMVALREHAGRVRKLYGIKCRFDCPVPVEVNEPSVASHLFRIAQEAVNNAIKHSDCENIQISLKSTDQRIILGVSDDGHGRLPVASERKGLGLHLMQFRANAINGTLAFQQSGRGGADVVCTVEV